MIINSAALVAEMNYQFMMSTASIVIYQISTMSLEQGRKSKIRIGSVKYARQSTPYLRVNAEVSLNNALILYIDCLETNKLAKEII